MPQMVTGQRVYSYQKARHLRLLPKIVTDHTFPVTICVTPTSGPTLKSGALLFSGVGMLSAYPFITMTNLSNNSQSVEFFSLTRETTTPTASLGVQLLIAKSITDLARKAAKGGK